eukprot:scaffold4646_cov15-Tisochrysis_lutea.AAC.1
MMPQGALDGERNAILELIPPEAQIKGETIPNFLGQGVFGKGQRNAGVSELHSEAPIEIERCTPLCFATLKQELAASTREA